MDTVKPSKRKSAVPLDDPDGLIDVAEPLPVPMTVGDLQLRPYQQEALGRLNAMMVAPAVPPAEPLPPPTQVEVQYDPTVGAVMPAQVEEVPAEPDDEI